MVYGEPFGGSGRGGSNSKSMSQNLIMSELYSPGINKILVYLVDMRWHTYCAPHAIVAQIPNIKQWIQLVENIIDFSLLGCVRAETRARGGAAQQ